MSDHNDKNQNAKSKIEQIREDLEKKLAAIEKAKTDSKSEIKNIGENISKVESIDLEKKQSNIVDINGEKDEDRHMVFEISDDIEDVKADEITKKSTANITIEDLVKVKNKGSKIESLKEPAKSVSSLSANKKGEDKQKIIIPPPKTVATSVRSNSLKTITSSNKAVEDKEGEFVAYAEEKSKKKTNYLLYVLLLLLFAGIAYMLVNYLKQKKEQQEMLMNQKLNEFKNKRYLDSIELADLNSQLLDLQSIRMIDSVDQVLEQELNSKSKFKNKKEIKRNFNVDGSEIVSGSKKKSKTTKSKLSNNAITRVNNKVAARMPEKNSEIQNSNKTDLDVDNNVNNDSENVKNNTLEDSNNNSIAKNETIEKTTIEDDKSKVAVAKEVPKKQPQVINSPIYPGCEKMKSEFDRKKCFVSKMQRNISRNFNADLAQNIGLKDGQHMVKVNFVIDKSGYATVLNVRAENKILEKEAIRVVQDLPKMKAGTINGKRTKISYNIPIRYVVNN